MTAPDPGADTAAPSPGSRPVSLDQAISRSCAELALAEAALAAAEQLLLEARAVTAFLARIRGDEEIP